MFTSWLKKKRNGMEAEKLGVEEAALDCREQELRSRALELERRVQDLLAKRDEPGQPRSPLTRLLAATAERSDERVLADEARRAALNARKAAMLVEAKTVHELELALEQAEADAERSPQTPRAATWMRRAVAAD
ncbi:MAG: hypothetical protein QM765_33465 [Myxococcales bacterium]